MPMIVWPTFPMAPLHSCGAWLASAGAHAKEVQTIMRHLTIKLTMDTYGHMLPGQEAKRLLVSPRCKWVPTFATNPVQIPAQVWGKATQVANKPTTKRSAQDAE